MELQRMRRTTVEFETIFLVGNHGHHAAVYIQEKMKTLLVNYEDSAWMYRWHDIGKKSFSEFLAGLDLHYLGGKLLGAGVNVFDPVLTARTARAYLEKEKAETMLSDADYADEASMIASLESQSMSFDEYCAVSHLDTPFEFHMSKVEPQWERFFKDMWTPGVVPLLRGEKPAEGVEVIDEK